MWRRTKLGATGVLLAISLAMACLWVRSYWVADGVSWTRFDGKTDWVQSRVWVTRGIVWGFQDACRPGFNADSYGGGPFFDLPEGWSHRTYSPAGLNAPPLYLSTEQYLPAWATAVFCTCEYGESPPAYVNWFITAPVGAVVFVTGFWPGVSLIRWGVWGRVLAKRKARGLCLSCGYDLRASGAKCPECGAEVRT